VVTQVLDPGLRWRDHELVAGLYLDGVDRIEAFMERGRLQPLERARHSGDRDPLLQFALIVAADRILQSDRKEVCD
jgi:hypothetical protein